MKDKEENFGVPKVDYTPMGQVEMLGNFYRSATKKTKKLWVRVFMIIFALLALVAPGVGLCVFYFVESETLLLPSLLPFLLMSMAGIWIIVSNLKNKQ